MNRSHLFSSSSPPPGVHTSAASPGQMLGPGGPREPTPALQRGPGRLCRRRHILRLRLEAAGQVLSWGEEWGDPDQRGGRLCQGRRGGDFRRRGASSKGGPQPSRGSQFYHVTNGDNSTGHCSGCLPQARERVLEMVTLKSVFRDWGPYCNNYCQKEPELSGSSLHQL